MVLVWVVIPVTLPYHAVVAVNPNHQYGQTHNPQECPYHALTATLGTRVLWAHLVVVAGLEVLEVLAVVVLEVLEVAEVLSCL